MGTYFGPFIYTSERSIDVLKETDLFLQDNSYSNKINQLAWAYHSIGEVIPHTHENLFSGHYFPWAESWDELQVSFSLCRFGLYKQAMVSLRSGLELGLLSVYWNLNDDAHIIIKQWLKSREDTPRFSVIWKRLEKHSNFKNFQRIYDIRQRLLDLGYLHDYVHSKGYKHSNRFGIILKPNFQSFDEDSFKTWYEGFRQVIEVLCILHLIKYPIGIIKYDYDQKFGMDKPSFGGLETFQVEQVEEVVGYEVFKALEMLTQYDETTKGIGSCP